MGKSGNALREAKRNAVRYSFTKETLKQHDDMVRQEVFDKYKELWEERDRKWDKKRFKEQAWEDYWIMMPIMLGIPLIVLNEEYGWKSRKRLPDFADKVIDEWRRFEESEESVERLKDRIYELTGFEFSMVENGDDVSEQDL